MKKFVMILAPILMLSACGANVDKDDRITVMSSMYPAQFLAEGVGGELVKVENITPPGSDPHGTELSPLRTRDLLEADVVVWFAGLQPAVDEALAESKRDYRLTVNVSPFEPEAHEHDEDESAEEHEHAEGDPHTWLDPDVMLRGVDQVRDALIVADPENTATYTANAAELSAELSTLKADFEAGLTGCKHTTIVSGHAAFGHLASAFGLENVSVIGVGSHDEPSSSDLARVMEVITERETPIPVIFTETPGGDAMTDTIARDTGATIKFLDPLELSPKAPADYLSVMQDNLKTLQTSLECQ